VLRHCFLLFFTVFITTTSYATELTNILFDTGVCEFKSREEVLKNPAFTLFSWTDKSKARAMYYRKYKKQELSFAGVLLEEAVIRFSNNSIVDLKVSFYNNGDNLSINDKKKFYSLIKDVSERITKNLAVKPGKIVKSRAGGANLSSLKWSLPKFKAVLSWSEEGSTKKYLAKYLNLNITSNSFEKKPLTKAELKENVRKKDDDVYIPNFPMVDQGDKGYCAVATTTRVLTYYGYNVDMYHLASILGTTRTGTSVEGMFKALKRLSSTYHFAIRQYIGFDNKKLYKIIKGYNSYAKKKGGRLFDFRVPADPFQIMDPEIYKEYRCIKNKADFKKFILNVKRNIDLGLPVIWGLYLGIYKEPSNLQATGGHMRIIIGYNDKVKEIIYSDSWGSGHEFKTIPYDRAWAETLDYAVLIKR